MREGSPQQQFVWHRLDVGEHCGARRRQPTHGLEVAIVEGAEGMLRLPGEHATPNEERQCCEQGAENPTRRHQEQGLATPHVPLASAGDEPHQPTDGKTRCAAEKQRLLGADVNAPPFDRVNRPRHERYRAHHGAEHDEQLAQLVDDVPVVHVGRQRPRARRLMVERTEPAYQERCRFEPASPCGRQMHPWPCHSGSHGSVFLGPTPVWRPAQPAQPGVAGNSRGSARARHPGRGT